MTEQVSDLTLLCSTEGAKICQVCVDEPRMVSAPSLPCNLLLMSCLVQVWAVKDLSMLSVESVGYILSQMLCLAFSFILPWHGHRVEYTVPPQSYGILHLKSGHNVRLGIVPAGTV